MRTITTRCCISGGGPAGIMLGFLLARSGVDVIVLEKWPDFFRDFRGDTIHPSTMQILKELGLLEKFLALPHNETRQLAAHIGGQEAILADFTHISSDYPFLAFLPQWDFLNFITAEAKKYPSYKVLMSTEATDLIKDSNGQVIGVMAKDAEGEFEIRSELVVGADGRHSTVREKSGLAVEDLGAPIDVLWFRLSRNDDGTAQSLGYIDNGRMMILIDRDSYWQCGFVIKKGQFDEIRVAGLDAFRKGIVELAPFLSGSVDEIISWDQIKMLSVAVDHLKEWYLPGLVCIGDSAHAMSPVGGVGINLAIQDAVAAANILVPAFHRVDIAGEDEAKRKSYNDALVVSSVTLADLKAIQDRRSKPALTIQKVQVFLHTHVVGKALANKGHPRLPWQLKLLKYIPYLRRIPARLIGVGVQPEHIETSIRP